MNVQHELLRLRLGIAEDLLKDVRHVGHQVDGVIPDDSDPWCVQNRVLTGHRLLNFNWRDAHLPSPPSSQVSHPVDVSVPLAAGANAWTFGRERTASGIFGK